MNAVYLLIFTKQHEGVLTYGFFWQMFGGSVNIIP